MGTLLNQSKGTIWQDLDVVTDHMVYICLFWTYKMIITLIKVRNLSRAYYIFQKRERKVGDISLYEVF